MEHIILNFFQVHFELFKHFGYLIIFLFSLFESLPLLGMLIPGQTIIILVGFLVKSHIFGFWTSIIIATVGAVIGDTIGFMLGRYYGHHFTVAEKRFYIKREQFLKTKHLIASNPFKSIFFGRLHSLTRTITPFASGASDIGLKRFLIIDFLSGFVWAFASILIGYIFGKSFEKASSFIGGFILVATAITLVIILIANYAKKKNITIERIDTIHFITTSITIYLFSIISNNITHGGILSVFDRRIYVLKEFIRTPTLDFVMVFFTTLGNPLFIGSLALVYLVYIFHKHKDKMVLPFVTIITGSMVTEIIKLWSHRVRPLGFMHVDGFSFPSWHATMAFMLATLLTHIHLKNIVSYNKRILTIASVFIIALMIATSRVYLGVHWASDSLAGICLGIFWTTFMILLAKIISHIIKRAKKTHTLPLP